MAFGRAAGPQDACCCRVRGMALHRTDRVAAALSDAGTCPLQTAYPKAVSLHVQSAVIRIAATFASVTCDMCREPDLASGDCAGHHAQPPAQLRVQYFFLSAPHKGVQAALAYCKRGKHCLDARQARGFPTCTRQREGAAYGSDCARSSTSRKSGKAQAPSTSW